MKNETQTEVALAEAAADLSDAEYEAAHLAESQAAARYAAVAASYAAEYAAAVAAHAPANYSAAADATGLKAFTTAAACGIGYAAA